MAAVGSKIPTLTSSDRGKYHLVQEHWNQFSWLFEIVCACVGLGALVAIVIILWINNGHPLQHWDFQINESTHVSLNVVIAILGTLCKSSLAVVLSSSLSQAKWNWFKQQKPLGDFEIFVAASRGPLGSFQLLWRTRLRLASLGATLTILSLTFDPFFQLLITYPGQIQQNSDPAITLSRAHEYTGGEMMDTGMTRTARGPDGQSFPGFITIDDFNMVAAMNNALGNDKRLEPTYNCLNGNCTWKRHVSIGVCNRCFNVTDPLKMSLRENVDFHYTIVMGSMNATMYSLDTVSLMNPNGRLMAGSGMNSTTTMDPKETLNFKDSQTLLFSFASIIADEAYLKQQIAWENTTVFAVECGLFLCSNTYSSMIQNGTFSETIELTKSERVPTSWELEQPTNATYIMNGTWNPIGVGIQYGVPRTAFEIELSSTEAGVTSLSVPAGSVYSLLNTIENLFHTDSPANGDVWMDSDLGNFTQYASSTMQALWSASSIESIFANLAIDMSARMRSDPGTLPLLTGESQEYITMIQIRWPFIIIPVLTCVAGMVFLCAMVIQTKKISMPLWKGSAMAGLVWGLDEEAKEAARNTWRVDEDSRQLKVLYKSGGERGELTQ